ncbi:MAG: response regulator [Chloroflexota bacterium]|nr:response regulator [Chloroflexota bacterium]
MRHSSVMRLGFFPVKRTYRGSQADIPRIKVVLAHDQVLFREGLTRILDRENDIQVIGQAASGQEAAEHCRRLAPDVLIADAALPPAGLDGLLLLLGHGQRPRILLLAFPAKMDKVRKAISSGIEGILVNGDSAELARTIRVLWQGERFFPSQYAGEAV